MRARVDRLRRELEAMPEAAELGAVEQVMKRGRVGARMAA